MKRIKPAGGMCIVLNATNSDHSVSCQYYSTVSYYDIFSQYRVNIGEHLRCG